MTDCQSPVTSGCLENQNQNKSFTKENVWEHRIKKKRSIYKAKFKLVEIRFMKSGINKVCIFFGDTECLITVPFSGV